jgi:hypothetical protein
MSEPLAQFPKDPDNLVKCRVDWNKFLAKNGYTAADIQSVELVGITPASEDAPHAVLVEEFKSTADGVTTIWLKGGRGGRVYTVTYRLSLPRPTGASPYTTEDYSFEVRVLKSTS